MFIHLFLMAIGMSAGVTFAASNPPLVDGGIFQPGRSWTWTYSQYNPVTSTWEPYYREMYTVSSRLAESVTMEMSSHSLPDDDPSAPAHHKFVVDLRRCSGKTGEEWARGWTIRFYTREPGKDWQLVSNSHPNLAFTEKFSCYQRRGVQRIESGLFEWQGQARSIFLLRMVPQAEPSWYFSDLPGFTGVMAIKIFGNRGYRAELTSAN